MPSLRTLFMTALARHTFTVAAVLTVQQIAWTVGR
jgi:hypothetical protein